MVGTNEPSTDEKRHSITMNRWHTKNLNRLTLADSLGRRMANRLTSDTD